MYAEFASSDANGLNSGTRHLRMPTPQIAAEFASSDANGLYTGPGIK